MRIIQANSLEHINLELNEIRKNYHTPSLSGSCAGYTINEFFNKELYDKYWKLIENKNKLENEKIRKNKKLKAFSINTCIKQLIKEIF